MKAPLTLADIPFEETWVPEPPAPPLRHLFTGADARRAAVRYHLADRFEGALNTALHGLYSVLPPDAGSAVGAFTAPFFRWRNRRTLAQARMETAIARLRPELDTPEAREPVVADWWRNTVRTLAEFAHVERLVEPGRLVLAGAAHAEAATAPGRPVIVISVHLASWEASFRMLLDQRLGGRDWFGMYTPQPNRFENRIVHRLRRRANAYAFPPTPASLRRMRLLLAGGTANLALLVDAPSEGEVHFPLFGRPLAQRCSLRVGIGLARRTGAILLPGYFLRKGPARFSANWLPPLDVDRFPADEAGTQAIARTLSRAFEPAVLENLSHWYMLDRIKFRALPQGAPARTPQEAETPGGTIDARTMAAP